MELFKQFFEKIGLKKKSEEEITPRIRSEDEEKGKTKKIILQDDIPDWADPSLTKEEEEFVAVIATAGLANSLPGKKFKVKSVLKVDEDWIVAGIAAISGVSQGESKERYRIHSITRVK